MVEQGKRIRRSLGKLSFASVPNWLISKFKTKKWQTSYFIRKINHRVK